MRLILLVIALACVAILAKKASAQVLTLPEGARTHWVVDQAEEIVQYLTFDPATAESRLPETLRFITIKELAAGDVGWAKDYLSTHPSHGHWGISFLEIVRMQTFMIDGLAPDWPEYGAAALWCARVAPLDSAVELGPGWPLLVLDFWMPDSMYVGYMREKGHYATYGNVRLYRDSEGKWHGSIKTDGLDVVVECKPVGPVIGGVGSAGTQALFPPSSSTVTDIVRVAFAGHRKQECEEDSSWRFQGTHPLVHGVVVGSSIYEFGYNLIGGAYPR